MKVLEFLKSSVGAIRKSALLSPVLAGSMIALNVYNYATDKPEALAPQIRSLSQIMTSGGELPREYSGIKLSSRGVDFATAEEQQAQYEGLWAQLDGGDAQVDALDKLDALNVKGSVFSGGEAGLGFNQAAVEVGPNGAGTVGVSGANGDAMVDAVAAANQTVINKLTEANGSLPRASMARVNAGGSSSSFSPYGTAGSAAKGGSPSRSTAVGPSSISGAPAMEGTTLVRASASLKGATGSDFVAASRNVSYRGGAYSKEAFNSLGQIARQSATVAKHAATNSVSANAHGQVFMAADQRGLGMQAVGDTFDSTESSIGAEDFEKEMDAKERALGQAVDEIDTTEEERKNHRDRLSKQMFALLITTFVAMLTISTMKDEGPWGMVAAIAVTALMVGLIGVYLADCAVYIDKYKEKTGWAIAGIVMGVIYLAAIACAWAIKGVSKWFAEKVGPALTKNMGITLLFGALAGTLGPGAAVQGAVDTVKDWNSADQSDLNID